MGSRQATLGQDSVSSFTCNGLEKGHFLCTNVAHVPKTCREIF